MRTHCSVSSRVAIALGLMLASACWAQAANPAKVREKAVLVKELRSAHQLLVGADHDYDGKRAAAAEEVHKAIRELEGRHGKHEKAAADAAKPAAAKALKAKEPALHESQQASDAQLNQALNILKGVQAEVATHHPKAGANVNAAIGHIQTALKIK